MKWAGCTVTAPRKESPQWRADWSRRGKDADTHVRVKNVHLVCPSVYGCHTCSHFYRCRMRTVWGGAAAAFSYTVDVAVNCMLTVARLAFTIMSTKDLTRAAVPIVCVCVCVCVAKDPGVCVPVRMCVWRKMRACVRVCVCVSTHMSINFIESPHSFTNVCESG